MNLKENVYFLGLGCAGGKLYKEFANLGYKGAAANGSEQDLKSLGDVPTKYKLEGFDGFGGHREKALDCLVMNEDFMESIRNIKEKIVFVLFGGGGSTGSGCATVLAELLLEKTDEYGLPERIVCPVNALPSSKEPIVKHSNAYQAVKELQELEGLGASFFLNNDSSDSYDYININFANMLNMFLTNDSYGRLNNFDESERLEMLRDSGAMVLSMMGAGKDSSLMIEKLTKKGIFAPIEENKICENIGIIHAGKDATDITADTVIAEVGKPSNVFEGYNAKVTLIAVSGLDHPVSHVSKLGELAKTAYEERMRNKKKTMSNKLGDLAFMEEETPEKTKQEVKKPSKLALLKKRQAERQKQ